MVAPGDASAAAAVAMLEAEESARREGSETLKRLQQRFLRLAVRSEIRRLDASPGAMPGYVASEARWSDLFVATCQYREEVSGGWA
jgi:hypothetical protein